ncbi:MAG: type-F conjugative transfer system pilin assembly protein TrbC [Thermodesulfobacteriota bacterium]
MLRILMKITRLTGTALVLALCFVANPACADGQSSTDLKMHDVSGVLDTAQKKAKELKLPDNGQADDCGCRDAAEKVMEKFNSPGFQAKMQDEQQRLRETVFKDILTDTLPQSDQNPPAVTGSNAEQLYLFVSSSVPLNTLRNYAAMIDQARAGEIIMVLRGLVGGMKKIRPTMEFIGEMLKKDPGCNLAKEKCDSYQVNIQVDPQLFQRFGIEQVPALAYLPISVDEAEVTQAEPIIIYGDAGLDYLLERINQEAKNAELNTLIAALRRGKGN